MISHLVQVSINLNKNITAIIDKTKEGNGRIIYPCAFGSNTYVEYININSGYKENIVLEKNININRFTFNWQSDSHMPVLAKDKKTIAIVNKDK